MAAALARRSRCAARLCRAPPLGARCCASGLARPPPGVLRLGLAAGAGDAARAAREGGPGEALAFLVRQGRLKDDATQRGAAAELDAVWQAARAQSEALGAWRRSHAAWEADCARLTLEHERRREAQRHRAEGKGEEASASAEEEALVLPCAPVKPRLTTQGCYLWGDVGRGKTLLMDLFALSLGGPVDLGGPVVRRRHFHDLMYTIHRRINEERRFGSSMGVRAAINEVLVGSPPVLCLDEFQITHIADATLMIPLFSELLSEEVSLVMTSNRPPEDLYKGGLNREAHVPAFVALVESRLRVHNMRAQVDYRDVQRREDALLGASGGQDALSDFIVFDGLSSAGADSVLGAAFEQASSGREPSQRTIPVAWGRTMSCERAADGVVWFSFDELCGQPLSADDYAAMVAKAELHTFILAGVPRFTLRSHNEARRFTNLVDTLYESQCRLICTAAAQIEELLSGMDQLCSAEAQEQEPLPAGATEHLGPARTHKHGDVTFSSSSASPCRPDTFATAEADAEAGTSMLHLGTGRDSSDTHEGIVGVMAAAIDSLRESGFASRRCTSRLLEMGTAAYRAGHEARWQKAQDA